MERHENRLLAEREDLAGKINRLARYLDENKNAEHLTVDFEGTVVYTPSFLEESFGGAIRKGHEEVRTIEFLNMPPDEKYKLQKYIQNAKREKK